MWLEYLVECKSGKFGKDCNETCDCSDEETCDVKTGQCSKLTSYSSRRQGYTPRFWYIYLL